MMDMYKIITDRIIKQLEEGTVPWKKPWIFNGGRAFNRITGKPYSLMNQLLLTQQGEYATYDQWLQAGGHVKKGEKGETVVFWKKLETEDPLERDDCEEERKRPHYVLRYYTVFHISQVEGVEPLAEEEPVESEFSLIEEAEHLAKSYCCVQNIKFETGNFNEAYYSPEKDLVHVPAISQYKEVESYYSTLFHELVHSTGHQSRLAREGLLEPCFGSELYSKEELIAEIGSAAILNRLGIETEVSFNDSVSYIESWLNVLKKDKRMIVLAASAAERAAEFIFNMPALA